MLLARILLFLWLITLGVALISFVVTKQQRYLAFAKRALKYGVIIALAVFAFFILERVVLIV